MKRVLAATVLLLMSAGCSSGSEYGAGVEVEGDGNTERIGGLDQPTPEITVAPQAAASTPAPTTAPAAAPTPVPRTLNVEINANGFNPFNFRVAAGTKVRVTNRDSSPRSFTADAGAFDSGPIAPGATWEWVASPVGTHNFHDETRPYVVGQVEVVAG